MSLTPDEEKAERTKDRLELAEQRKSAERQSIRTLAVGVIAGIMGLVGGLGKDLIASFAPKEAKPAYTVQVTTTPFDGQSRVGLLRVETATGTSWHSRTNAKGQIEWVKVIDASNSPVLPAPAGSAASS